MIVVALSPVPRVCLQFVIVVFPLTIFTVLVYS